MQGALEESIKIQEVFLLVLSSNSIISPWVRDEVKIAMEKEREQNRLVIYPLRIDDAVMDIETGWPADIRRSRYIGDFKRWKTSAEYEKSFERLLRDLRRK